MKAVSWANVGFGVWLIIAPFVYGEVIGSAVSEEVLLGVAVAVTSLWSVTVESTNIAPAWINLFLGLWIVIAPWAIGYATLASTATTNDVITGVLIAIVAGIRIGSSRRIAS